MRQCLALVAPVTRGNKVDSLTMTFTMSSSSTRHSCWMRNLAASFSGGMGTSIATLYLWYSLCSKSRNIFPCTVYGSGNVKQDSAGGKMWEQVRQDSSKHGWWLQGLHWQLLCSTLLLAYLCMLSLYTQIIVFSMSWHSPMQSHNVTSLVYCVHKWLIRATQDIYDTGQMKFQRGHDEFTMETQWLPSHIIQDYTDNTTTHKSHHVPLQWCRNLSQGIVYCYTTIPNSHHIQIHPQYDHSRNPSYRITTTTPVKVL